LLRSDAAEFRNSEGRDASSTGGSPSDAAQAPAQTCGFLGEPSYLKALTPTRSGLFGNKVAVRRDSMIVSALLESAEAVPEPGMADGLFCPGDDVKEVPSVGAGAIYVYDRDPRQEPPVAKVTHGPGSPHVLPTDDLTGFFRYAIITTHPIAVNESWLAIGGAGEANFRGSMRLFKRAEGSTDAREPALSLSDGQEDDDLFGFSVALDGDLLAVGAPRLDGITEDTGAAFVYRLDSSGSAPPLARAEQVAKIQPPGLLQDGGFGAAIAFSDEWIVITAPGQGGEDPGAAYAFRRDETPLGATPHLIPAPEGAHLFGASVALDGDWLAIGAPGDYIVGVLAGSAHLYHAGPGGWEHVQALNGGEEGGSMFGWSLAFLPEALLVGHPAASHGRPESLEGYLGAVHAFERDPSGLQRARCIVRAKNPDPCDGFGMTISVGDRFVAIGSPFEDGERGGLGEPDLVNGLRNAGAVYMYPRLTPGTAPPDP
jgi:hypothetical protein